MTAENSKERRPRPRIEGLSDLVFGLSLSLASISLIVSPPNSPSEVNNHILAFVFAFILLITAWINYTSSMSVLPLETRTVTVLNVIMLMSVALVPFLLNVIELPNLSLTPVENLVIRDYASMLFAVNLAALMAVLGLFSHILAKEEAKLIAPDLVARYRTSRNLTLMLAGFMLLTAAPIFGTYMILGYPIRLYVWYAPIIVYWIRRLARPV
ncbi:MAG: TMEM175 family protein [Candidatus Bathyarchaeia archaeon]|jgi:uncharacterized membrane protein